MSAPGPKWTCRPAHLMSASEGNTSASEGNADTVARTDTQGRAARETELGIAKRRICNRTRAIWMIPAATEEDKDKHSRGAIRPSDASSVALRRQRAQGMPGARRTHCLACKTKKTHAGQHRYAEITPALPAQWLYGLLRALPGVSGLLAPVACGIITRKLDTSVEVPGPRGLTVREPAARLAARPSSIAARATCRGDRETPSVASARWKGM
jgi:hypothetical protein